MERASEVTPAAPPPCPSCNGPMEYHGGTHGFIHCGWMLLYRADGWLDGMNNIVDDRRLAGE